MTDEQINIAIAKACGWKINAKAFLAKPLDKEWQYLDTIPDYCNDLNAMHEAVRILESRERITYSDLLHQIAGYHSYDVSEATARQRAEAFLKTINKWKD
jgi:hypothetical protein